MNSMETEIGGLEAYWPKYVAWCKSNGLYPDFGDFLIYLDEYDIQVGQNDL